MSKHRLSPAPLPAAKRQHTNSLQKVLSMPVLNFDSSLYDELVLSIFSHLSWMDLCMIQPTNKNWARLTTDNQLWKKLFIQEYGRLRLRGSRGFVPRNDGREVKPLPHRSKEDDHIDWKWMFRISLNWMKGRCYAERVKEPLLEASGSPVPTCVILAGSFIVTTSAVRSRSPKIYLHKQGASPYCLTGRHKQEIPTYITSLVLDQSPPSPGDHTLRLIAFFDTGGFTVFQIDHTSPHHSRRLQSYLTDHKSERTTPIRQASYHHPLLVTLSHAFQLSLYNLSDDFIVHTQTLTSFTSFPPTSMVLTPSARNYRLVLAYSAPVFPRHWGAAVTVLTISSCQRPSHDTSVSSDEIEDTEEPCRVIATRTVRSWDVPMGWIDEVALRSMREQWGRKVARVADTQTDGKWVVLAPADRLPLQSSAHLSSQSKVGTTSCALQLYRLHIPSSASSSSSSPASTPKMTFVRMLYGHAGPVSALALADGRCVSLGADGSIWVWDLEKGWSAEVQTANRALRSLITPGVSDEDVLMGMPQGSVVFDERRIVSADSHGIELRRFDI